MEDPTIDDLSGSLALYTTLGIEIEPAASGIVVARIARSDLVSGPSGSVHGGVLSTLVDIAGAGAVASREGCVVSTVSLSMSVLAPASLPLRAVGKLIRAGRTLGHSTVEVSCGEDVVATGLVVLRLHRSANTEQIRIALESAGHSDRGKR